MKKYAAFPPYEMLEEEAVAGAAEKTARLERLYHLTQKHAWDGKALLSSLIEKHGPPGAKLDDETRGALSRVMTTLMWGELAAWNISADLALGIDDMDAKMAATAQVFDEARHFYVMRDYVRQLGPVGPLGGLPKRLLRKVLEAPTLATKLVGMQLLFETNAVVIFKRLAEAELCPVLSELLPYIERDESRHVGLGVMYVPRLIERMDKREARRTARFQAECLFLLMGTGLAVRTDLELLQLNPRLMMTRVTSMQDEIVGQMVAAHGRSVLRAVATPKGGLGPHFINFLHPAEGLDNATPLHRTAHIGLQRAMKRVDRALA